MIIKAQFYSISIPNPQAIPPPQKTCLLWKLHGIRSLYVSICCAKKFICSFFYIPYISDSTWHLCLTV